MFTSDGDGTAHGSRVIESVSFITATSFTAI